MQSEKADVAPLCRHLANWMKHTRRLRFWSIWFIIWKHTSFTKPEVGLHNVSYCRQRRSEPRPQVTCTENLVKFECVIFKYASEHTDRQTNTQTKSHGHADRNTLQPHWGKIRKHCSSVLDFWLQNYSHILTLIWLTSTGEDECSQRKQRS